MSEPTPPCTFISYAWTDDVHSAKVLALAERLSGDGVLVRFDKWDLQPGHDAIAFMEQAVTDPAVTKVLMISNRTYVDKANSRRGGVGTETQIISPRVYEKTEQQKFILVAFELGDEGRPYVPAFYGDRIYINLTQDTGYEEEYDRLLRSIFERPLHRRPPLGRVPSHILEDGAALRPSQSDFRRAIASLRLGESRAMSLVRAYRDQMIRELDEYLLASNGKIDFDEDIVRSISDMRPIVTNIGDISREMSRQGFLPEYTQDLARTVEGLQVHTEPPPGINQWRTWDFDNYRFIAHEAFLTVVAVLLDERQFAATELLLSHRFVNPRERNTTGFSHDYAGFWHGLESLEHRNRRLALNRRSLQADLINERAKSGAVGMNKLIEADVILFLRDASQAREDSERPRSWWPITIGYLGDAYRPLELFARAEAASVAKEVLALCKVSNPEKLKELIAEIGTRNWAGQARFFGPNLSVITNVDRLGRY